MKNIAAQMVNFDCEQMRRIANNMPEQYDEKPQVQQVAQIINGVFSQLLATFPASLATIGIVRKGHNPDGSQRWQCRDCRRTFSKTRDTTACAARCRQAAISASG